MEIAPQDTSKWRCLTRLPLIFFQNFFSSTQRRAQHSPQILSFHYPLFYSKKIVRKIFVSRCYSQRSFSLSCRNINTVFHCKNLRFYKTLQLILSGNRHYHRTIASFFIPIQESTFLKARFLKKLCPLFVFLLLHASKNASAFCQWKKLQAPQKAQRGVQIFTLKNGFDRPSQIINQNVKFPVHTFLASRRAGDNDSEWRNDPKHLQLTIFSYQC